MTIKGYSNQKKLESTVMEYATVSPVRTQQHGLDVRSHSTVYEVDTGVVGADSTTQIIDTDLSGARKGDLIHFVDGVNAGHEAVILSASGGDLTLAEELATAPTAADTVRLLRFKSQEVTSSGGGTSSFSFTRNGSNQTVTEDTATPANNRPLPVKLMDFDGPVAFESTNLNLKVQTSHSDAAPDSMQIGDGTEIMLVNADGSINAVVSDGGGALTVDGTVAATQSGTWNVTNVSGTVSLPTGASTEAKQDAANALLGTIDADTGVMAGLLSTIDADTGTIATLLGTIDADTGNIAASTASVAADTAVIAGDTTSIDTKTPALGQAAMAASVPVVIANNQSAIPVKQSGYASSALITHDHASGNVTNAAYVEIDASLAAATKRLHIFDSSGEGLILATGAAASEVDLLYIPPGGFSCPVDIDIAATTRLSIKALSTTTTVGTLIITALG